MCSFPKGWSRYRLEKPGELRGRGGDVDESSAVVRDSNPSCRCAGGVRDGGEPSTAAVLGRTAPGLAGRGVAGRSRPRGLAGRMPGLPAERIEAAGLARRYGAAELGVARGVAGLPPPLGLCGRRCNSRAVDCCGRELGGRVVATASAPSLPSLPPLPPPSATEREEPAAPGSPRTT